LWPRYPGVIRKPVIGVEDFIADVLICLTVVGVTSALSAQVENSACNLAPLWANIIGLNFEFSDRILRWDQNRQVDVTDIERLAVQVLLSALIRKRATIWKLPHENGF
jgi:hypothetical protein